MVHIYLIDITTRISFKRHFTKVLEVESIPKGNVNFAK